MDGQDIGLITSKYAIISDIMDANSLTKVVGICANGIVAAFPNSPDKAHELLDKVYEISKDIRSEMRDCL